jgi:hypothetical protein
VVNGATFGNLMHILVVSMVFSGDLNQNTIASKLITFKPDGVSVLQSVKTSVTIQLKN